MDEARSPQPPSLADGTTSGYFDTGIEDVDHKRLCTTCELLLNSFFIHYASGAIPTGVSNEGLEVEKTNFLEDSANKGCPLCLLFIGAFSPENRKLIREYKSKCHRDPNLLRHFKMVYRLTVTPPESFVNLNELALSIQYDLQDENLGFPQSHIALFRVNRKS
jgi:hypothetical protein